MFREFIFRLWLWDAKVKIKLIEKYLEKNHKIIDIGSGLGSVTKLLNQKGYDVLPIDIKDISHTSEPTPLIFNGKDIPFENNFFDIALILTVLHHSKTPEQLISEAKRVSSKVIIIEDVYDNTLQKHLTYFTDSLVNMEFFQNPHNNKSDNDWKYVFKEMNLKLIDVQYRKLLFIFKQVVYILVK